MPAGTPAPHRALSMLVSFQPVTPSRAPVLHTVLPLSLSVLGEREGTPPSLVPLAPPMPPSRLCAWSLEWQECLCALGCSGPEPCGLDYVPWPCHLLYGTSEVPGVASAGWGGAHRLGVAVGLRG